MIIMHCTPYILAGDVVQPCVAKHTLAADYRHTDIDTFSSLCMTLEHVSRHIMYTLLHSCIQ